MAKATSFFEVVGGTPLEVLSLLLALGVVGFAGFCVYVVYVSRGDR